MYVYCYYVTIIIYYKVSDLRGKKSKVNMWLRCVRFKPQCAKIFLMIDLTGKKNYIYKYFFNKKSRGSFEPPEIHLAPPMLWPECVLGG